MGCRQVTVHKRAGEEPEEVKIADEVAAPEAARFAGEPVGPLDAELAGPDWSTAAQAGLGIECGADGDGETNGE